VAGLLFLIFPGTVLWRLPLVARLDLWSRLAIAFAGGVVIVATLLYLYSFAHVPWTRTTLALPLIAIGCFGVRAAFWRPAHTGPYTWVPIAVFTLLTIYGVATARETCGDLMFFWGPKGQHFHYAGKIDAAFLGYNHYYLMHSDYPPLVPLLYAWGSLVAHRFSWWGALFLVPILLLATAFALRGLARNGWYAALLTAILAYGFAIGMVGGAADPVLLFFEVIAIAALTFDFEGLAAIASAAVAFTKVEPVIFVAIAAFAYLVTRRRLTKSILIPLPAAILFGWWIAFASGK